MAVKRRDGRWVVEFMQAGHRVFKRLPAEASRQDALDYETKLRREIFDQRTLGKRPNVSLEYAINAWLDEKVTGTKSEKATRSHASAVSGILRGEDTRELETVCATIRAGPLANATKNRRLCILKAVAKFALGKGWTEENLSSRIPLLTENNARHFYLTDEQLTALIEATPERSRAFVGLAVYTGIRQGQIVSLQPSNIVGGAIRLPDSKTGQPILVPVIEPARKYLAGIPFKLHKRTHYGDFEKAREALGLGHITYHDLRHTTASLMIQAGVSLYTVGEILGHKSVQTTKRYAHLAEGNKRDALNKAFPSHQDYSSQPPDNEDK